MSDSRKSSRARKTVCYSKFGEEEDSDDDFARATAPPPKKSKIERKDKLSKTNRSRESKEKKSPVTSSENRADRFNNRKERAHPDEKVFDREMQLALEMSMHDSEGSQQSEAPSSDLPHGKTKDVEAQIHLTAPKTENLSTGDSTSDITDNKENVVVKTNKPPPSFCEPDDEIVLVESLDEDEVVGGRRKRKAAKAAVAKQRKMASEESEETEDAEFKVDCEAASSDEYDSDNAASDYEEFTASKKKMKPAAKGKGKSPKSSERSRTAAVGKKAAGDGKPKATPKRTAVTSKANKPSTPVTPLARRPQATGPVRGFTPPGTSGGNKVANQRVILPSPQPIKRTTWSSPSSLNDSNPLGGVKLVSPNQHIRLGLSRNIRIKPLHPNAKAI